MRVVESLCVGDNMRAWLEAALVQFELPEEAEGYLLGRGMKEARIQEIGVRVWDSRVLTSDAPDRAFREGVSSDTGTRWGGHGSRGQRLDGRLCTPIWGPTGRLIGFEGRSWQGEKKVTQYLLPDASWNPVFLGLTPTTMRKLWMGGDVWVGEGVFDMAAMEHVIPDKDMALATLRARVSPAHATFFKRHCRGWVNLVYDNDDTGRRQTFGYKDVTTNRHRWGAIDILQRVGVRVRDVPYRGGKDPGEIWERRGTPGLRQAFGGVF